MLEGPLLTLLLTIQGQCLTIILYRDFRKSGVTLRDTTSKEALSQKMAHYELFQWYKMVHNSYLLTGELVCSGCIGVEVLKEPAARNRVDNQ